MNDQLLQNAEPEQPGLLPKAALGVAGILVGVLGIVILKYLPDEVPQNSFKLAMSLGATALMIAAWHAGRRGLKTLGIGITSLLLAMTIASAYMANKSKLEPLLLKKRVHAWNVFHYVLGTKYFDELGYFDLYKAALLADSESDDPIFNAENVPRTRDMHTYKEIPRSRALAEAEASGIRDRFTAERWASFKRDLRTIQTQQRPKGWNRTLQDLGFNPSPAWLIIHRPLLNAVDISSTSTLQALCSLELIFYLFTFLMAWWAFGLRTTLIGTLWVNLFFGNSGLLVGSYFHYDWLFLTVAAAALYYKGHRLAAAPVLAYAAMMRGFPGLLAIHPAICWLKDAVRLRMPARRHTVFLFALGISCIAIVGLGGTTSRGFNAWLEWKEKIAIHSENHPVMSPKRIGLIEIFANEYKDGSIKWAMPRETRRVVLSDNMIAYRVAEAILLALTILAMLRRNDHEGLLLGFSAILAALCLSRYYASAWALLFTWTALDRRRIVNLASSLWIFGLIPLYLILKQVEPRASEWKLYYIVNSAMVLYFLGMIGYFLAQDLAWLRQRYDKSQYQQEHAQRAGDSGRG